LNKTIKTNKTNQTNQTNQNSSAIRLDKFDTKQKSEKEIDWQNEMMNTKLTPSFKDIHESHNKKIEKMNENFSKECLCATINTDNLYVDNVCKLCKQKRRLKPELQFTDYEKLLNKSSSVQNNQEVKNKNMIPKRSIETNINTKNNANVNGNAGVKYSNNNYSDKNVVKKNNFIKISQNDMGNSD